MIAHETSGEKSARRITSNPRRTHGRFDQEERDKKRRGQRRLACTGGHDVCKDYRDSGEIFTIPARPTDKYPRDKTRSVEPTHSTPPPCDTRSSDNCCRTQLFLAPCSTQARKVATLSLGSVSLPCGILIAGLARPSTSMMSTLDRLSPGLTILP